MVPLPLFVNRYQNRCEQISSCCGSGRMDPHHFGKLDPEPYQNEKPESDPHQSQKQDPHPHLSQNSGALDAQNGAMKAHPRDVKAKIEAWRLTTEPWRA
jgi:hypothetical protein